MQRLKESQEALTLIYDAYNDVATNPLAPLDIDAGLAAGDGSNVGSVLYIQNKKALKESTELRSSIADVLLLLDGCDIKEIKAAMRRATATAAEEVTEVEK